MTIERTLVPESPNESVTSAVKVDVPAAVGVPEIIPLLRSSKRPAGSEPFATEKVYGVTPRVAVTTCAYGVPTTAAAKFVVEICGDGGAVTVRV